MKTGNDNRLGDTENLYIGLKKKYFKIVLKKFSRTAGGNFDFRWKAEILSGD